MRVSGINTESSGPGNRVGTRRRRSTENFFGAESNRQKWSQSSSLLGRKNAAAGEAISDAELLRDVNAQRQSDLRKIDSNLGVLQNNTGAEIMRQRQVQMNLMNYIVRTSDKK